MTDEEFQNYFPTVYPKMFVGHYGGVACGKGWFDILRILCQNIQNHIDWKNNQRNREIEKFKAREEGFDALLKFYSGEREASDWELEQTEYDISNGVVIPPEVPQVTIAQIKEKFGTLRFYYDGGDEYIAGLVTMAEGMTSVTCEECGDHGVGRHGGWVRTLCDKHEAEYQARRKQDD